MKKYKIPDAFNKLAIRYHQDIHLFASNDQEIVAFMIRNSTRDDLIIVKLFIEDLFAKNTTPSELEDIWTQTSSDFFVLKEKVYNFFSLIKNLIDQELGKIN